MAYGWQPDTEFGSSPLWQANLNTTDTLKTAQYNYLHTDHLGTVQLATDSTGQVTWKGNSEAFGKTILEPTNKITMNLRFPGQYYDQETGTHYNYFRDYNPNIGRYNESDPIGLDGGINSFAYVNGNPANWTDNVGLRTTVEAWCVRNVAACLELGFGLLPKPKPQPFSNPDCSESINSNPFSPTSSVFDDWFIAPSVSDSGAGNSSKNSTNVIAGLGVTGSPMPPDDDEGEGDDDTPKNVYNSPKQDPNYPKGFRGKQNGQETNKIDNSRLHEQLRNIERGKWDKIYHDGWSNGEKVSLHYFRSPSGKSFDLWVKKGWSNTRK